MKNIIILIVFYLPFLVSCHKSSNIEKTVDVYVAGHEHIDISGSIYSYAKYWKNGEAVSLTGGLHYANANSIFVTVK